MHDVANPSQRETLERPMVTTGVVEIDGEPYIVLRDVDAMDPFFMSIVSNFDHWVFAGSNGAFTAGRMDAEHALFPYRTADHILRDSRASGSMTALQVRVGGDWTLWEPWRSEAPGDHLTRNLYKHEYGASVIFEEIHHGLGLRFSWSLGTSNSYGVVRECELENLSSEFREIRFLDGFHQLLPAHVPVELFTRYSYLAAAYMRHEIVPRTPLAIYTLNTRISDHPEPAESLRAACAWSNGLDDAVMLLSDRQVGSFLRGGKVTPELEKRAELGAYLLAGSMQIESLATRKWMTVADTDLDHSSLLALAEKLHDPVSVAEVARRETRENFRALRHRVAAADGLQQTADRTVPVHHFANVLFNSMRGGTLNDGYRFPSSDFASFLRIRNRQTYQDHRSWLNELPATLDLRTLSALVDARCDPSLSRLAGQYLPLVFSRRHGDPSRPWNQFVIKLRDEAGNPVYSYEGNWRDIFQNWEALAQSFPECLGRMLSIFLNASTAEGYNPYRISRDGIDWEVVDPTDPWSHIGYWGDHQIVYLLRLLESEENHFPGRLAERLFQKAYGTSLVPYEIKPLDALLDNPRVSINFNQTLHEKILQETEVVGSDAKLLRDATGEVVLVNLGEKLLIPLLTKLSNLVPGGGIWLNTQRPEWNDANNALAGWGLSVVTVCHMRRYLLFLDRIFEQAEGTEILLSRAVGQFLKEVTKVLEEAPHENPYETFIALGRAGERNREEVYRRRAGGEGAVPVAQVRRFISGALKIVDTTIAANRRDDGMYHGYNLLDLAGDKTLKIGRLDLMLEGQVAVLSSGFLSSVETLRVLSAMRESALYREDQASYLLYPDREIAPFLSRNTLPEDALMRCPIFEELLRRNDRSLVVQSSTGSLHFQGDLANSGDVERRLEDLAMDRSLAELVTRDREAVLMEWETVFNHRAFTGRSGSMFGFEGLGSIYWHMVAKLLVAVEESHCAAMQSAQAESVVDALADSYDEVRGGLGFSKSPLVYGAFPSDPYSHTPASRGAQQPGMTGQVKEEILTRRRELGVTVSGGELGFFPRLLHAREFLSAPSMFHYVDVAGVDQSVQLPARSLAFTCCQVPVVYTLGRESFVKLAKNSGPSVERPGAMLTGTESEEVFGRSGTISVIRVTIQESQLRRG